MAAPGGPGTSQRPAHRPTAHGTASTQHDRATRDTCALTQVSAAPTTGTHQPARPPRDPTIPDHHRQQILRRAVAFEPARATNLDLHNGATATTTKARAQRLPRTTRDHDQPVFFPARTSQVLDSSHASLYSGLGGRLVGRDAAGACGVWPWAFGGPGPYSGYPGRFDGVRIASGAAGIPRIVGGPCEYLGMDADFGLLRPADAARRLSVCQDTLRAWRDVGEGPPYLWMPNGRVRYRLEDLVVWLRERTVAAGGPVRRLEL